MIFSKLCSQFYDSPNYNSRAETDKIKYLIPHCTDGLMSYTGCNGVFGGGTNCSCNYLIDKDGVICGVVAEENRSWCSSSRFADFAGITIEIASEKVARAECRKMFLKNS